MLEDSDSEPSECEPLVQHGPLAWKHKPEPGDSRRNGRSRPQVSRKVSGAACSSDKSTDLKSMKTTMKMVAESKEAAGVISARTKEKFDIEEQNARAASESRRVNTSKGGQIHPSFPSSSAMQSSSYTQYNPQKGPTLEQVR